METIENSMVFNMSLKNLYPTYKFCWYEYTVKKTVELRIIYENHCDIIVMIFFFVLSNI